MRKTGYALILLICVSLLFNGLFIVLDVGGYVLDKVENRYGYTISQDHDAKEFEKHVVSASIAMLKSQSVEMQGQQYSSTIVKAYSKYFSASGRRYAKYDYPTAFLLAGLAQYAALKKDRSVQTEVEAQFQNYILPDGRPSFKLEHVDQAVFGLSALDLYAMTGKIKYKVFSDNVFSFLKGKIREDNGIIPYETGKKPLYLVDTIGMVCPFLSRYGSVFSSKEAIGIAVNQLTFFRRYGVDEKSHLPFHQISTDNIPLGPNNWGRGIGWYMYAIAEYDRSTAQGDAYIAATSSTLDRLKTGQSVWSQFPGTTEHFDASPTVMILYSEAISKVRNINKELIFTLLNKYTSNGKLQSTSGDTMGVDQYSNLFGPSEVSQGFLMMLLSITD